MHKDSCGKIAAKKGGFFQSRPVFGRVSPGRWRAEGGEMSGQTGRTLIFLIHLPLFSRTTLTKALRTWSMVRQM